MDRLTGGIPRSDVVATDLYSRCVRGPVLVGDVVEGRRVIGFAYSAEHEPADACNDRLLVDGDEELGELPARVVPTTRGSFVAVAELPPRRLPVDRVRHASEISEGLPATVDATLTRVDAPWWPLGRLLVEYLDEAGHLVWITGGAARDLLAGDGPDDVHDLDLTGTALPGCFTEHTRRVLRRNGMGEYVQKVSPDRLVCSVTPPLSRTRSLEYRSLMLDGFSFPASGSDMSVDARCRDLTVNSLYYDPRRHLVVDPTGQGVQDLRGPRRRLVSLNTSRDPLVCAAIVIRALKFILRWQEAMAVDTAELRQWIACLPTDLFAQLDESRWLTLITLHRKSIRGAPMQTQREATRQLGPVASALLDELLDRQR